MEGSVKEFDKSTWGDGPWQTEPDRLEWRHLGLPCLMVRNDHGTWCGYVGVPPGHPAHGAEYNDVDVNVHGGLTYAKACAGDVCHVPEPGESDDVHWLGFDCNHGGDMAPAWTGKFPQFGPMEYRDVDYVKAQVNGLAKQLKAL